MPRRPRVRLRTRLVALTVPWLALAPVGLAATTGPSPSPATTPTAPTALPLSVQLRSLTPIAPQPIDTLRITGTLRNTSSAPVADLSIQLRYRPTHIGSRSEFDDYACGTGCTATSGGLPTPLPPVVVDRATISVARRVLPAGAGEAFVITAPMKLFTLHDACQVYELGVSVQGSVTTGFTTVGGLRTFLPWSPVGSCAYSKKVQVSWVWPLVDRPHRTVDNDWTDNNLAASIAAGGRLSTLLSTATAAQTQRAPRAAPPPRGKKAKPTKRVPVSRVPVTWAVDPLLVEDIQRMAGGYHVGGVPAAVTTDDAQHARAWLTALHDAVANGQLLALPYADPDVVAATRDGLASQVQVAINSGQTLLSSALGATPLTYSWPPDGVLDQHTLDTLFAAGVSTVLLDGSALPIVGGEPSVTPNAHTTVRARDGNLDALVLDSGLDAIVRIGAQDPTKQPLAEQRFIAETLMIQAELPGYQRSLVVAPDRRWAPDPAYAATLLANTGKVPWIQPVPLSAAGQAPVSTTVTRDPLRYADRAAELPRSYLDGVRALKRRADSFAAILAPGDAQARAFDDATLRTMSSAFRAQPEQAESLRDAVAATLNRTMRRVRIASLPNSFVTLTSNSGPVPITVANELDTPVRVIVAIRSQHLKVSGGGRAAQTIPPHRQIAVDVRATARTAGVFPLTVALLTPTGQAYSTPEQLFVRSTAYATVTIFITGGATGMLLIAVIIRLTRRALRARRGGTVPA